MSCFGKVAFVLRQNRIRVSAKPDACVCVRVCVCEADVILTEAIAENTEHILSLEVKDTQGETTIVESRFQATAPRGPFIG